MFSACILLMTLFWIWSQVGMVTVIDGTFEKNLEKFD